MIAASDAQFILRIFIPLQYGIMVSTQATPTVFYVPGVKAEGIAYTLYSEAPLW